MEPINKPQNGTGIGRGVPQIDSYEKVTGKLEFITDLKRAGMLYGKILRSDRPHANIVSINTSKAEALPGVVAVVTAADTAQIKFGPIKDDWVILAKDRVRFIGEEIAAVAAVDELTALRAISLIDVEYEDLPAVFDPEAAMEPSAPQINPELVKHNISSHFYVEKGAVDQAFAQADLVLEETFTSPRIYQGYVETNACIAEVDGKGYMTMWAPAHGLYNQKLMYARALDIPSSRLTVIKPNMGGSFGAKFENNTHLVTAVLAIKANAPVRIEHTREEDIMASNGRVSMKLTLKLGLRKDGKILAKQIRVVGNNGARTTYSPPITAAACYRNDSLYLVQNVRANGYAVYTNTAPTGCMRGFGNAQGHFAMESLLDMAAEKLGMDPVELRLKNCVHKGDVTVHGWIIGSCGLEECVEKVISASRFHDKRRRKPAGSGPHKLRGVGFACANHATGNRGFFGAFDGSSAIVRILDDGTATLIHGEADLGQGQHTVYAQMLSEVVGIGVDKIAVLPPNTDYSPFGLGSWASRGTLMGGNAVIAAGKEVRSKLLNAASDLTGIEPEDLTVMDGKVLSVYDESKYVSIEEAVRHYVYQNMGLPLTGHGVFLPDTVIPDPITKYGNISPAYPYASHVAEVEVDINTGKIEVLHYWAADDVGRVINELTLNGQLIGGIAQGIGWALTEKMIEIDGRFVNDNFLDYKMLGPCDMPRDIHLYLVETHDPNGPFGAKGASEIILNPIPAAIANAVYNAIGVRMKDLPITPDKVLEGLGKI